MDWIKSAAKGDAMVEEFIRDRTSGRKLLSDDRLAGIARDVAMHGDLGTSPGYIWDLIAEIVRLRNVRQPVKLTGMLDERTGDPVRPKRFLMEVGELAVEFVVHPLKQDPDDIRIVGIHVGEEKIDKVSFNTAEHQIWSEMAAIFPKDKLPQEVEQVRS